MEDNVKQLWPSGGGELEWEWRSVSLFPPEWLDLYVLDRDDGPGQDFGAGPGGGQAGDDVDMQQPESSEERPGGAAPRGIRGRQRVQS